MDRFEYIISRRPNYEVYSTTAWMTGAAATLALGTPFSGELSLPIVAAPLMLSLGSYRAFQAYQQYIKNKNFTPDQNIEFIDYEELKNKKARDDAIWMGKGFAWTPAIAQRLYDEFMRNPEAMQSADVDDPNTPAGAFWLHSLGLGEKDIYKSLKDFEGHSLIAGVTGAGKTRTVDTVIAQLLMRKDEPMIMIDPKNDEEARENIRKICEKEGRPFYFFHPAFPEKSCRIDVLHTWVRATQISDRIKAIIPGADTGDGATFANIIWNVVNAIGSCLVLIGEPPSIVSFRKYMTQENMDLLIARSIEAYAELIEPDWRKYYAPYAERKYEAARGQKPLTKNATKSISMMYFFNEVISSKKPNADIQELINVRLYDRQHLDKLISSLFPVLSMLSSGGLDELLSPVPNPDDDRPIITTQQIVDNRAVLWMGLDTLSDQTTGSMIGSIILSDMTSVAGSRYNFGKKDGALKVNLVVDEVAEVMNTPLIAMLNKSRSAGFRIILLTQTLADFVTKLGSAEKARMAIGNINNNIILRLKDGETAKYFAESLPEVLIRQMGTQYQSNVGHNPLSEYGGRYGETMQEEYKEIFPAWAFGVLPNLHYLGNFTGGSLVKGRLPIIKVD
ncbi:conjugative transfer system coupling protein TraD [Thiomicrorhabdus hydrogeniphila]